LRHRAVRDGIPLHLIVFLVYNVAMSFALLVLRPPLGLAVTLFLFAVTLHLYLLREREEAPHPRRELLRLNPLDGGVLGWTISSVPVMLVFIWALSELYISLIPVPPEVFNPFGPLLRDPLGRLSIAVVAIAIAPVVEEFFFRGLIQRRLELRWGATAGIVVAALFFALVHVQPWVFPLHFLLGVLFGWVVYVTRSIWSGVVLHAANNAAAVVGLRMGEDAWTRPTIWEIGIDADWWTTLVLFVVSAAAGVWVARRLAAAARIA
jgi:membrane protease YdiL (CAAX protease family)